MATLRGATGGEGVDPRVERSRAASLDAAIALIVEEGWDAATQPRVAERAGVGRATVYRHWPDRMSLLHDALQRVLQAVPPAPAPSGDVEADLVRAIGLFGRQLSTHGLGQILATMADRAERDPAIAGVLTSMLASRVDPLAEVLRLGVANGQLEAGLDVDACIAELLGPLIYRRLIARRPLTPTFTRRIVADVVAMHAS